MENERMRENVVLDKSFGFAVRIVNLYKHLTTVKKEYVLSKQVLRSGTAIGALVREAQQAESNADFLDVKQFESLKTDLEELLKLLVSIIKKSKEKRK
jgi:hypothetical protein